MSYYFSKVIAASIPEAMEKTKAALAKEGFGVLTEIDVQGTMKKKLGAEMKPYLILGACHPESAYKALQAENKIGTMLPCNVIVQELGPGKAEITAVDPIASMQAVTNPSLGAVAAEVQQKLKNVIASL